MGFLRRVVLSVHSKSDLGGFEVFKSALSWSKWLRASGNKKRLRHLYPVAYVLVLMATIEVLWYGIPLFGYPVAHVLVHMATIEVLWYGIPYFGYPVAYVLLHMATI